MAKNKITLIIISVSVILLAIIMSMTQSKRIDFLFTTKIMIPGSAYDIRYNSNFGGMGDGEEELSFKISEDDKVKLLGKKPFGQDWSTGPYLGPESEKISSFPEVHQITNSDSLKYVIKYKNPENISYDPTYTLLIVDVETNTVLLKKSNF
jgi:hypothetical protein